MGNGVGKGSLAERGFQRISTKENANFVVCFVETVSGRKRRKGWKGDMKGRLKRDMKGVELKEIWLETR